MRRIGVGVVLVAACLGAGGSPTVAQTAQFVGVERRTNGEVALQWSAPVGEFWRIEAANDLTNWVPLSTVRSSNTNRQTDTAAAYLGARFYRAVAVTNDNVLTGDHLVTDDGEVVIHPVNHASLVLGWQGQMIYNDPVGGAAPYAGLPRADLILVSHAHPDHFESGTLNAVRKDGTVIIAPAAVLQLVVRHAAQPDHLPGERQRHQRPRSRRRGGAGLQSHPPANPFHSKGAGNGYVVTVGGRRLYFCGDTGDIPEMRALADIDVAFVCMNVPYTMTVNQAASAVREFGPRVVYPYHYRNQNGTYADLNAFQRMVGTDLGIEVRRGKWY